MRQDSSSASEITGAKARLRKAILARRDALTPAERAAAGTRITQKLLTLDTLARANTVMAYMSIGSEFDTTAFVTHVLAGGKTLVLPRVAGNRMLGLHAVRDIQRDLRTGVWGIREPERECPVVAPAAVDWVLVPGVAFSRRGARLGYGGGYYDALLPLLPAHACVIAAAFSIQVVGAVPMTARDQYVGAVISEKDFGECPV